MRVLFVLLLLANVATGFGRLTTVPEISRQELGEKARELVKTVRQAHKTARIIGGKNAPLGRYPYFVELLLENNGNFFVYGCGGSLIAPNVVLTAAHCFDPDPQGDTIDAVLVASHDTSTDGIAELIGVTNVVLHPDFDDSTLDNDYMLLKLASSSSNAPISIDNGQIDGCTLTEDDLVTTMGFGNTIAQPASGSAGSSFPDILQEVDVKVVPADTCSSTYGGGIFNSIHICAGSQGKDSCQGDSGGPLIIKGPSSGDDVLVGVVSFGIGCAAQFPGVYSKVSGANGFIIDTLSNDFSVNTNTLPPATECFIVKGGSHTFTWNGNLIVLLSIFSWYNMN